MCLHWSWFHEGGDIVSGGQQSAYVIVPGSPERPLQELEEAITHESDSPAEPVPYLISSQCHYILVLRPIIGDIEGYSPETGIYHLLPLILSAIG